MLRRTSFAFFLFALGCGSSDPYCGEIVDVTGRPIAFCPDGRQDPVCNFEGQMARFQEGAGGIMLVGGERAMCSFDGDVVCPAGTVGEPYCITDPEL